MNLEKEIGNSLEFMTNGGTSEIYRSDDGTIVARPTPVRMGATGMDLQPPIRRELSQAEPQTFEQTKKDIVPTLVGLPAGATAATLGTLQDIAGLIYGGVKAMGAEEGQKMQTFLDTAGEISDKYGSGAVKGYIRQKAEEAGLDEDQLKVLDEAMMIGEFGGIGGMVKAAVTKGPQALSKAGDMVEDASDAAKARMAGGPTFTSGVNPDPLIAAAGDAVAKFRAPTEKNPGIIAFHGSGADFDEFKLEKIGTGEGAQAYGYGLYFTDSEDIAKFYRDTISAGQTKIPYDGAEDAAQAIPDNIPYLDIDGYRSYLMGDAEEVIANILTKQYFNSKPEQRIIDANLDVLERDGVVNIKMRDGSFVTLLKNRSSDQFTATPLKEKTGKMYKVGLAPKPDELVDFDLSLNQQPEKIKKVLQPFYEKYGVANTADFGTLLSSVQSSRTIPDDAFAEKLVEAGIPGIKYRAAGSRGASVDSASAKHNYVIFDDKMIKILEKYGIVGPVAITGIAASKQESEPDAGA